MEPPSPEVVVEPLKGPPRPTLLVAQAVLVRDASGRPHTAPARLDLWRQGADGSWARTRLEDPDSNVFHKAFVYDGAVLTIGAEAALVKRWVPTEAGWDSHTLWQGDWPGRYDRLRDAELGDVDADGQDELVIATHDQGVVAVLDLDRDPVTATELGQKPEVFVHEIELGDLDGDGHLEIYYTPSGRNRADSSQGGGIARYRWTGQDWEQRWVAASKQTHAKEILVTDLDGDGRDELYGVFAAVRDAGDTIVEPTQVLRYVQGADGEIRGDEIATLDDRDARFLVAGDLDADGRPELAVGAHSAGLLHLVPPSRDGAEWELSVIDPLSSGFEHAILATDLDGDGRVELYVSSDEQQELRRYRLDPATGRWDKQVLGALEDRLLRLTWNLGGGVL